MLRPTSSDRECSSRSMMACHTRHRLCVCHKGNICMPRPTWSDRVCCPWAMITCHTRCRLIIFCYPREMMACHARYCPMCRLTVYIAQWPWWHATPDVVESYFAIQGRWWHATPDIVWLCFAIQGRWWHTTPDVVWLCVPSIGDDVIYARRRPIVCAKLGKIYNWME